MAASLFDSFTRHQIYLEGYKNGLEGQLDFILRDMYEELQSELNKAQFNQLNDLTKQQLNKLIRTIHRLQLRRNDAFREKMLRELRAFAQADLQLSRNIMENAEDMTVEEANKQNLGLALLGLLIFRRNRQGRARLWGLVSNAVDPASGLTPKQAINHYLGFITRNVRDLIKKGYANGWTMKETMSAIFGTSSRRFRDGFTWRARRAGAAMLRTIVQHISSRVQAGATSMFYTYYRWAAVLDERTTKICRSRNKRVYRYGKGPLPPAHYNCRSKAVPVRKSRIYSDDPDTFYEWLKLQPAKVQNDLVGRNLASGLRSGRINAKELGRFRARNKLTLQQFLAKYGLIVAP